MVLLTHSLPQQSVQVAVVEEAQPAVSENVQKKILELPTCKDNENLLKIRHSVCSPSSRA